MDRHSRRQPRSTNILVNVMPIEWHEQYVQKRLVVGRAEAPQTAAIGFDLAGSVVNILVDEGQRVTKGKY